MLRYFVTIVVKVYKVMTKLILAVKITVPVVVFQGAIINSVLPFDVPGIIEFLKFLCQFPELGSIQVADV